MKNEQDFWNFLSIIVFILIFTITYYILIKNNLDVFYGAGIIDLTLISLATFRVIRLIRKDKVMSFFRDFFEKKKKGPMKTIHEITICPWCIGIWVSLLVIPVYFLTDIGKIFVLILAIAGVGSFLQILISNIDKTKTKSYISK